jgi:hypothetical protein
MLETPTELKPWTRYTLTAPDQAKIHQRMQSVQAMPNTPGPLKNSARIAAAGQILLATKILVDEVRDLRKERGYAPLQDDTEFQKQWDLIEVAGNGNNAALVIPLVMEENIKLVHEINGHRRALGRAEMKTYR